ncbi:MAG TPA: hypothetical protein VK174_15500 [Chitinophagales bacterium]|nr:hypothetical protein [Chitinophagales bacterium]
MGRFSSAFSKSGLAWLAAMFLLLPLLWLNVRHSHPWGDDFAAYVTQTINMGEGRCFDYTTYQFIDGFSTLWPSGPIGFSVMLLPVYKVFGFNISAFTFFMAGLYMLWAILSFGFFLKRFSVSTALLMLFVAFYSNFLLWLKVQIISDVPFALLILLVCLLWQQKLWEKVWGAILIGLLIGFTIHVRSLGIVLLPAVALHLFYQWFFKKQFIAKTLVTNVSAIAVLSLALTLILGYIFKPQYSYISNALSVIDVRSVASTFMHNAKTHMFDYMGLFKSSDLSLSVVSSILGWLMLVFTVVGALLKWRKGPEFFDWVTVLYLVLIMFYQVTSDYRYLVPVHPFLIFYLFYFLKITASKISVSTTMLKAALFIVIAFLYKDHLVYLGKTTIEILPGPYEEASRETFSYIKNNVNNEDIIVFNKPRALALYTGKKTIYYNAKAPVEVNVATLHKYGARYYLYSYMLSEPDFDGIINANKPHMTEVYKNWQFTLYKDTSALSNFKTR